MLSGCATMPMSQQEKNSVHTIFINPDIKTGECLYAKPKDAPAVFFGVIGDLIYNSLAKSQGADLEAIALQNKINIAQIVKNQFIRQIRISQPFKVVSTQPADAILSIKITEFGFIPTGVGFSAKVVPVLRMSAKLTRNNKVIWKNVSFSLTFEGAPQYTAEQLKRNPKLIKQGWHYVAKRAVAELVQTM